MTIYYLHSRLCLPIALIEYLTVLLGYLDLLQTRWHGTTNNWEGAWPFQECLLGTPLFETTTVSRALFVSAILVSDYSCFMCVHSL